MESRTHDFILYLVLLGEKVLFELELIGFNVWYTCSPCQSPSRTMWGTLKCHSHWFLSKFRNIARRGMGNQQNLQFCDLILDNLQKWHVIVVDWCCWSSFSSWWGCKRIMELAFLVVWGCMGYASKGEIFVDELEGTIGIP